MHSHAPVELGSRVNAFCASARARANCPFFRSSLQLRTGSLTRTVVAMRCAITSASAAAVPGLPLVAVKRPAMPELPMSIISTSAASVVPPFVKTPVVYACTWRKRASCFACWSSSRPLHGNPDCASASHGIGQRDARGRVRDRSLEGQDQQAHGRLLRRRELLPGGRCRNADRQGQCELKRSHRGRSSVTGCYINGRRGIRTPDILRVRQAL